MFQKYVERKYPANFVLAAVLQSDNLTAANNSIHRPGVSLEWMPSGKMIGAYRMVADGARGLKRQTIAFGSIGDVLVLGKDDTLLILDYTYFQSLYKKVKEIVVDEEIASYASKLDVSVRTITLIGGPLHGDSCVLGENNRLFVYVKDGVALHYRPSKSSQNEYIFDDARKASCQIGWSDE